MHAHDGDEPDTGGVDLPHEGEDVLPEASRVGNAEAVLLQNVDDDCPDGEKTGIGCCDKPTKMCFVSELDKCPTSTTGPMQPAYN